MVNYTFFTLKKKIILPTRMIFPWIGPWHNDYADISLIYAGCSARNLNYPQ